jgi:bifunctional non-homologous end joining protein LigD
MTELVPELAKLPVVATLDGELCAFGADGAPDFPLICERMLMRRPGIVVTYMVFDVLSIDGRSLLCETYSKRRTELEALDLNGVCTGRHRRI